MTLTFNVSSLFNELATVYDQVRPEYPDALVRDVMELGELRAGMRVLEIGAGTGLATLAFARHDLRVHCVEPSRAMAAILAAKCAQMPNVTVEVADFSDASLAPGGYDAVVAAQCWQYLDPAIRLKKSAHALCDRGILALFWHSRPYPTGELATNLDDAHRKHAPELLRQNEQTLSATARPQPRLAAYTELFESAVTRKYQGRRVYSVDRFISLLDTYGEYYALPAQRRATLYAALRRHLSPIGESVETSYDTVLHTTRLLGR